VRAITRYIAYRVSDDALVEDLTAEVFLRMVEGLPAYQVMGVPFEAWLYRIAAARVADYYRARQRHPEEALSESLHSSQTPAETHLQESQELDELRAALSQLSEEHQTILILRFVERKSHEEVAAIMGKSVRAVATAQHRALRRLADLLGTDKLSRHYIRGEGA
jgi:RNA polymerase sigma-70 factor (ECF subfamily)